MQEKSEFSRLMQVEGLILDKVRTETFEATPEECVALAARFGIPGVDSVKATLSVRRVGGSKTVEVIGKYEAEVVQSCVVSLRNVPQQMAGDFKTYFSEDAPPEDNEIDFAFEDDESNPEHMSGGVIDLGEVTTQYVAIDLDPYPRAPGVSLAAQMAELGLGVKNSPFQVLETLQEKDTKKK